jgi:hypothetical protein
MKRELVCKACVGGWQKLVGKYPGEDVKIVKGTALRDYVCDDCGKPIGEKEFAAAVSVSTPRTPYTAWETDCIKPFPAFYQSSLAPLK